MNFFGKIKEYFKYYPEEEKLPIDWCPICEEKLKDNKRKTRMEHNRISHTETPEEKRKRISRSIRNWIITLTCVAGIVIIFFWLFDNIEQNSYCLGEIGLLNKIIREEDRFPIEHLDKFEHLVKDCNMVFDYRTHTGYKP